MEQRISQFLQNYVAEVYFPNIRVTDIVEILFLAFLISDIHDSLSSDIHNSLVSDIQILF